jgi:hypothetical protein
MRLAQYLSRKYVDVSPKAVVGPADGSLNRVSRTFPDRGLIAPVFLVRAARHVNPSI